MNVTAAVTKHFDTLEITLNEPHARSRSAPHCSCGNYFHVMKITTVRFDGITCDRCGYAACWLPVSIDAPEEAIRKPEALTCEALPKGAVIGLNLATGESVAYRSANAAKRAGFGSVGYAVRTGREINGYRWQRAA